MSSRGGIPPVERPLSLAVRPPPIAKPSGQHPTPPLTPISPADATGASFSRPGSSATNTQHDTNSIIDHQRPEIKEFDCDLELSRDEHGNPVEFGRGAWSIVYSASSRVVSLAASGRNSPPPSPEKSITVYAVKLPLRPDARVLLTEEAKFLTHLSKVRGYKSYVVPFHGYIPAENTLVMAAVPLSLSDHILKQVSVAPKTTKTMFDPILGMPQWLSLAKHLIEGLHWLHCHAKIIHGDLKPHNILLRPRAFCDGFNTNAFPYDALFADFTSAYDPFSKRDESGNQSLALSALTPPFVAPELLTLESMRSADTTPTMATDVFALAVTLLAAAVGDLQLYPHTSSMQLLAMSRDGHNIIDHVRTGPHYARIPRKGVVEKILSPAFTKGPKMRIQSSDWLQHVTKEADGMSAASAI